MTDYWNGVHRDPALTVQKSPEITRCWCCSPRVVGSQSQISRKDKLISGARCSLFVSTLISAQWMPKLRDHGNLHQPILLATSWTLQPIRFFPQKKDDLHFQDCGNVNHVLTVLTYTQYYGYLSHTCTYMFNAFTSSSSLGYLLFLAPHVRPSNHHWFIINFDSHLKRSPWDVWTFFRNISGGFLSHRDTPNHHPF